MAYLVLVANYWWIFKRKSHNLRALITFYELDSDRSTISNKIRHVVNNTLQYSAYYYIEKLLPIGLVCWDCCFHKFSELPTWYRKPMSICWPYPIQLWWLAPLPFTPEFGVRFPVSAVWKKQKCFFPIHVWSQYCDREVACSASDRQGSNFEYCVWRTVSFQSSHHPQEVLPAQFSLYVHKGGLKPDSFHLSIHKM